MTDKIRVDLADLTFGELADAGELIGQPLAEVMGSPSHFRYIAAVICVTVRRSDPAFTLEQALALKPSDVDIVADTSAEPSAGSNGAAPVLLPVSGT